MADLVSSYLGVDEKSFTTKGIFNAVIGVDTRLFLDPHLLKDADIQEFKNSRNKILKYYTDIIHLLVASKRKGDAAWREALRRLMFKELHGVSIGYGVHSSNGNAIGRKLALRLIDTAKDIIDMGVQDPEIFELIGLFEEDFGSDRLSDMTINIIRDDIYDFTQRVIKDMDVQEVRQYRANGKLYNLPKYPNSNYPLALLPQRFLRDLPIALSWEGIDHVVSMNRELRDRVNRMIGVVWKNKVTKRDLRDIVLTNKGNINELISFYKTSKPLVYDFKNDPASEVSWYAIGKRYAERNPVSINVKQPKAIDDLESIVKNIIDQFKKIIEFNGMSDELYVKDGVKLKPRHERFSQRLFYAVADSYCQANEIDISREPNAGSGPVDFKLSMGYRGRILVEIKLSSNRSLIPCLEKQIPAYQDSESADKAFYVVIRVTKSETQIKRLMEIYEKKHGKNMRMPKIIVIDGWIKPSASKRK